MPITLHDPFWSQRQRVNAEKSIFHQWKMLEDSHCIDNFRIVAGDKQGFREGWFFSDSDAYKWLEAASLSYHNCLDENNLPLATRLKPLIDDFIALLSRTQRKDGYIFTFNQFHFPGSRWDNLMIEHELYCHGHFIEAGDSHFESTGEKTALDLASRAADLLTHDFMDSTPDRTSGHEEIEIALLRLYEVTGRGYYLKLAHQFLERRGRVHPFAAILLRQNKSVNLRSRYVQEKRLVYLSKQPEHTNFQLPPNNYARTPLTAKLRWQASAISGKYFQMNTPIRKQTAPVGHAVRFTYLATATAMLFRHEGDLSLLPSLKRAWDHMVTWRMYITGGIGSLPILEGFGNDYELDPEIAYNETCAALGSLFWNWEMARITGEAKYSDLFEWQLYNAAAPGMGMNGETYLYNNPLACRGGLSRRAWFKVPCCPSNLSRAWASLQKYVYSFKEDELWIHQYIGSTLTTNPQGWNINMESNLPWEGKIRITLGSHDESIKKVHLRIPSWTGKTTILINGSLYPIIIPYSSKNSNTVASGYDPRIAQFLPIIRSWSPNDVIDINFDLPITIRRAHKRVRGHRGKVALTRGPLVYCLESMDNPCVDISSARMELGNHLSRSTIDGHGLSEKEFNSITYNYSPSLLGGTGLLHARTTDGRKLTYIPYFLWANRGESQMTVWIHTGISLDK